MARGDIRSELDTHHVLVRNPNQPVLRVFHPVPVRVELGFEVGDGSRVRVLVLGVWIGRGSRLGWLGQRGGIVQRVGRSRFLGARGRRESRQQHERQRRNQRAEQ
jgi:hypothetical protein